MISKLLLLWISALIVDANVIDDKISLSSVERSVDLVSQLVKTNFKMTFDYSGSGSAKTVLFALGPEYKGRGVYAEVTSGGSRMYPTKLASRPDALFWTVELQDPLQKGNPAIVVVETVVSGAFEMYPIEITQKEKQLVRFFENHYVYSPYKCKTQTAKIDLPSGNIESHTKLKPTQQSGSLISYGPYTNIPAFSSDEMVLHYENNNHFLVVKRMERLIELSMWGNIAVMETLDVHHCGAKLKGSFSRYDYQRENLGASSVGSFKSYLPASAQDVYYRDEVGNISTSALRVHDDFVELELKPRFPLFGGWKTHYTVGYNVPAYQYLYTENSLDYLLDMRLLDHVYDDMIVEDLTVKIILPEGVTIKDLKLPYSMIREPDRLHFTYLDTTGRTLVTLKNSNVMVEKHIQNFKLKFQYHRLTMVREALMLIAAFLCLFVFSMIYVRLDFSISKDEGSETRMKVAGFCEIISSHQDRRARCYTQFDDALVKLKSTRDINVFQNAVKKINADHASETNSIAGLYNTLKTVASDVGERVMELQKLDKLLREHQVSQAGLVEKLVGGKLNKQQFIDQESVVVKKKGECVEKINTVVRTL